MKKFISITLSLFMSLSLFSGCQKTENQTEIDNNSLISFYDDDGREVNLDAPCEKIISFYSAHTENLFELGAGDKLIGGHSTCVYPPEAAFLDHYDYNGDPENIIAAQPDAILIRPFITNKVPDFVAEIEKAGIQVISLYPENFEEFDDYINKLALITGTEETAEKKLEEFHNEISEISEAVADINEKPVVFFESTETDIRTVTPDSMAAKAIEYAGGINLAKDVSPSAKGSSIAEFGAEKVLENADNIDVYVSQRGAMNSGGNLQSISERAGYNTIKAVKENKVFLINEKIISSPTFRYVKGINELARFFYPEKFDNIDEFKNDNEATRKDFAQIITRMKHIQIYLPSSSKYYETEQKGHMFGLFEDVKWTDDIFDEVETAVNSGYIEWELSDGKEYFRPDSPVTRDELAKSVFIMGEFENMNSNTEIKDISECENQKIIQILVDNGVFELENGNFNPQKTVTCNEIIKAIEHTIK